MAIFFARSWFLVRILPDAGFIPLGLGSTVFAYLLLKSGYVPKALAA